MSWLRCVPKLVPLCRVPSLIAMSSSVAVCPIPVIVPVTAGVCSGCRIMIPPQTFIELQGGHKIINCPNCQRLIYWVEHFNEETNQTADEMAHHAE